MPWLRAEYGKAGTRTSRRHHARASGHESLRKHQRASMSRASTRLLKAPAAYPRLFFQQTEFMQDSLKPSPLHCIIRTKLMFSLPQARLGLCQQCLMHSLSRCNRKAQTTARCTGLGGPCGVLHADRSLPSDRASGSESRQKRRRSEEHRNSRCQGGRARRVDVCGTTTVTSVVLRVVASGGIAAGVLRVVVTGGITSVVLHVVTAAPVVATCGIASAVLRVVAVGGIVPKC